MEERQQASQSTETGSISTRDPGNALEMSSPAAPANDGHGATGGSSSAASPGANLPISVSRLQPAHEISREEMLEDEVAENNQHVLMRFSWLPMYKHVLGTHRRARRRCRICRKKSGFYCGLCSDPNQDNFVTLCNPVNKKGTECFHLHIRAVKEGEEEDEASSSASPCPPQI